MCGAKLVLKVTKTAEIIRFPLSSGANDVTRTHDLLITNQLLYRLSYISIFIFGVADLILTNQLLYQLSYTSICDWNSPETLISAIAMIAHFSASVNLFSAGTCDFPAE